MHRTSKLLPQLLIATLLSGLFAAAPQPALAAVSPPFSAWGAGDPFSGVDVGDVSRPTLGDLDADGDLDALVADINGTLHYFRNTGTATTPVFTEITGAGNPLNGLFAGVYSAPTLGDLDGDGDLDVVVGENGGFLHYYRNTGTIVAPVFTPITGSANPFNGLDLGNSSIPTLGDVDGDGDLDALVGVTFDNLRYLRNTGTATFAVFSEVTGPENPFNGLRGGYLSTPTFSDLDSDGDLDAIVGELNGIHDYFRNTGTATAPVFTHLTGSANPFDIDVGDWSAPAFGDLDGDGDPDVVIGSLPGRLTTYRNDNTPTTPAFVADAGSNSPFNGADVGAFSIPATADLDGDGDLDAIVGKNEGTLSYFRNTGTATAPLFTPLTGGENPFNGIDVGGYSAPTLADLDGDGDLDAVVGELDGYLNYYRNTGTAVAPVFAEVTGSEDPFNGVDVGGYSIPAFADLDGDGDPDAVVGEQNGTLLYFCNIGTATAPVFTPLTGSENPFNGVDVGWFSSPTLGDLDRDGDLEALVGEDLGVIHFFRNTGTATDPFMMHVTGSENPFNGVYQSDDSAPALADLDADGDLDVVVGNAWGFIDYLRHNRAPRSESSRTLYVLEDASNTVIALQNYFQDPDRDSLTYTLPSNTNPGLFSAITLTAASLTLDYLPETDGSATLTLRADDPFGRWAETTLTVIVIPLNDAPGFTSGEDVTVDNDSVAVTFPGWATGITPGAANESGQTLTFVLSSDNSALFAVQPAVDPATGDLTFTPAADTTGSATVSIYLQDSGGTAYGGDDTSDTRTFTITVTPINDPPQIVPVQPQSVAEGTQLGLQLSATDSDLPAQTVSFSLVSAPEGVAVTPGGWLTWTPTEAQGPGGYDIIVLATDDGSPAAASSPLTFSVSVSEVNQAPQVVNDDNYSTPEDTVLNIPQPGVLGNDTDADLPANALSVELVTPPATGSLTLNADGSFSYTPAPNFTGVVSFVYRLSDGQASANATATILVVGQNDLPAVEAGPDQNAVEGQALTFSGSFSDPDGRIIRELPPADAAAQQAATILWDFGDGTNSSGSLTPEHTFADDGTYTVRMTVVDGTGGSGWDELTVTVGNADPLLDLLADRSAFGLQPVVIAGTFSDPGALDTHTVTIEWAPGVIDTLQLAAGENAFSFTHAFTTLGGFPVTVTVTDEDGGTVSQTFTITTTEIRYYLPMLSGTQPTDPVVR